MQNKTDDPKTAAVNIYDDIIPFYGVNAVDFRNELQALGDGIETIDLHIHSRGGNVYEAVAIMNTLRQHSAKVVTTVDSVAASAAGFIAVGASDELIVAENAEIMAHLPWVMAIGDANDLRKTVDRLDQIGKNIASIFSERAGGTVEEWMDVLTAETWWSAQEAVDAGIADRVLKAPKRKAASGAKNSIDLSVFNHAGRSHAPAPRKPQAHNETPGPVDKAAEATEKKEEANMATLSESVLQKLGLDADADDSAIEEAINKIAERPEPAASAEPTAEQAAEVLAKLGMVAVNKASHDEMVATVADLSARRDAAIKAENEAAIQDALTTGRIDAASADTWRAEIEKNRDGTLALLNTLPANKAVPVNEIGHGVSREDATQDAEMATVFANITGRTFGKDA
ncbi:head maturation protease, ClpP-related [Mycolicibacterium fortuitum]|uniref:ATP-dependent Clp protease proteolytic subunit n=1 Tax=Mycolicibacterium fortuitum TaxID=1766 RepID=A0AAE4V6S0_MYCFO|nr:head maturation protease, ClpP-related [Mycolicibacterium fortuitum]MDV7194616.1 ATP-dependent Clp protease proteolytic subunit [Mycolicibacterium fortuitum]MDV7208616.1 ATP-dependent Clp protease proteolytic subunit [Mycolicibacterium fortuitum]MDV7230513.1 ATP-dependent Clp protease proteolytic subunit [Mycolicibacterium fortuitum]MDV7261880.1 ATP-dependent Clp protease proteolytic subunit [Mycolicibacterium fortuitum]MDV7287011.1 ATP-dependent Clp protease proteolytic subunit [Mycoliciba